VTRRVTLLSDFGTADGYVAAMKGVLASRAPDAFVDDVAHDLPAGDVDAASRALARYWSLYPEGTVHVVVVDPGVGTTRRGLALSVRGRFIVAPDNGIVTDVLAVGGGAPTPAWRAVELIGIDPPGSPSRTFHGRDLFAPAAALLAAGEALAGLGPSVSDPVRLPRTVARRDAGRVARGTVTGVDRFGNLSTDLPGAWLDEAAAVEIAGRRIRPGGTYADVAEGALVALVGSDGRVEIAARNEAAARALGVGPGAAVVLRPDGES
jgi:hypothetical protein